MKKIFFAGLILTLISVSASAQKTFPDRARRYRMEQRFSERQPNRMERFGMRNNMLQNRMGAQRGFRGRMVGPMQRRRMMMRQRNRRHMFIRRQQSMRRVI